MKIADKLFLKKSEQIVDPELFSIFTNPTNLDFSVSYIIDLESPVKFVLSDSSGTKIKTLLDLDKQTEGNHYYTFSIPDLKTSANLLVFTNGQKTLISKIAKN